ncbi:hypothetical protein AQJ30_24250 [Streptomyces longwoodensis]|uniref:Uncharacterized protein n=1 Tax=Streptomyces longwoodensis TaxID=68231 RepID=A0A124HQM2_9ACTN|nr:hypothetical protein AQJ30_24250 [Streptomyces longwoodensis]
MAGECSSVSGGLQPFAGVTQQRARMAQPACWTGCLAHRDHLDSACREASRHRQQERPGAPQYHAAAGRDPATFEECLEASDGEHTRQVPAGEGQLPVIGPRRYTDSGRAQNGGGFSGCVTPVDHVDCKAVAVPDHGPHMVRQTQFQPSCRLARRQGVTQGAVLAQTVVQILGGDCRARVLWRVPPELAADSGSGVHQHDAQSTSCGRGRSGHAGRSGADNDEVK